MKIFNQERKIRIALYFSVYCFVGLLNQVHAQSTSNNESIPLVETLQDIQEKYGIKISYDATLVGPLLTGTTNLNNSLDEVITSLNKQGSFKLVKVRDDFYLLKAVEREYKLSAKESDSDLYIPPTDLSVFINNIPVQKKKQTDLNQIIFRAKLHPRDTIQLYTYGYNTQTLPAIELMNSAQVLVSMVPDPILLSEVIVSNYMASGINANTISHSIDIDMENLALLPGETDGDIFESIKALPGISNPDSRAGNIYIRGSSTDQSLILYDDIPIYHKGHYFGTISPYNPKVVDGISVYRNGFSPRLGGRVGGAVDIRSTSATDKDTGYGLFVNSINAMGYISAPIVKDKLGIVLSGRTSYPASWNSPKIQAISDMIYQGSKVEQALGTGNISDFGINYNDATGKVIYNINKDHQVSLSSLFITNVMRYQVRQVEQRFDEENKLENLGLNLRWDSKWSDKIITSLSLTHSDYNYSFFSIGTTRNTNTTSSEERAINELKDLAGVFQLKASIGSSDLLTSGVEYKRQSTYYDFVRQTSSSMNQVDNTASQRDFSASSISPFVNYEFSQISNLYLQVGVRGTYFSGLNDFAIAPRIFLNYNLNQDWQLKGSFGLYNQYLSQIRNLQFSNSGFENQLWLLSNNEGVKIIKGQQRMLGSLFHKNGWVFDIEAYSKLTDDVTYLSNRFLSLNSDYLSADIETSGIDIFVKKQLNKNWSGWVSYSASKSTLSFDTLRSLNYRTEYDQPHIMKAGGLYSRGNWKVSVGWRSTSGLTAEFPEAAGDVAQNGDVVNKRGNGQGMGMGPQGPQPLEEGQHRSPYPFSRFPSMHQLDASISWSLPKNSNRNWKGAIGLSLINILNNRNLIDQVTRKQQEGETIFHDRFGIGFAPNLMVSIEW